MADSKQLINITCGGVRVDFTAAAAIRDSRGGAARTLLPEFDPWKGDEVIQTRSARCGDLLLIHSLCAANDDKTAVQVTLRARNVGQEPVYLESLTPLWIKNGALSLGETDSRQWLFYRQGRHKNDLPSVCCLGDRDERFADALVSLAETGGRGQDGADDTVLVSDSLSILRAGENSADNLMIGFVTSDKHMVRTLVELDENRRFKALAASSEINIRLDPGKEVEAEWVEIAFPQDVFEKIDAFALRKARRYGARVSDVVPSVYCTWYYYGLTVSARDVLENLHYLTSRKIPFDVYQIDEGWERVLGDWRPNDKFPEGMQVLARDIAARGYVPGLWTSPFIAHETAPITAEHPEWFLNHTDGTPCFFPMNNTIYRVLDVTHPDARRWVKELYQVLRGWGYLYHKLDFTRAAVIQSDCVYYDETVSIATAYRAAVQCVRDGIGQDAYLLMCGGLYDPLIGLVDAQRAGSDVLSMWSQQALERKGGKVAPFTIKQSLLRFYMNRWWHNDPDALMVRRQKDRTLELNLTYGLLNDTEALTSTLNQYIGGGIVCSTEPMAKIEDDRLMLLRHIVPALPVHAVPRDLFGPGRYPSVIDVAVQNGAWHTVCVINWSDTASMPCTLTLGEALLGEFAGRHAKFLAAAFDGSAVYENLACGDTITMGTIPPHGSMVVKIMAQDALPAVVGSDAHFSMGAELDELSFIDGVLSFKTNWGFQWPVRYDVLLPEGWHCGDLPAGVSASGRMVHIFLTASGPREFAMQLVRN